MAAPNPASRSATGKTRPPRLGRVFERSALFEALDRHASAPGVWVTGHAGMGKTTLVATYLQARTEACVWLQLDAADADPATFGHFLREAGAAVPTATTFPAWPPPGADDLRDVPAYVQLCLRRLALGLEPPWTLVLDNAQELGAAPGLHAGLANALAHLPPACRLILISREPPPDEYAGALVGQRLALLDEQRLRFDDAEAQRLVELHGRRWTGAELRQATDGWAAAMILLLATRTDAAPGAELRGGPSRGRLFAFFADEVMAEMPAADAAALMRIAFLPSATPAMAEAVSADPRAGALLADLARRSLFTDRREGEPPAYTFHALFSEFLRARAAGAMPASALRELQVDAARVLAAHGQADAGIARLIEAQAWPEALDLILAHAGPLVAQGRAASVRDALLALPEAARDTAAAWYWLGHCESSAAPLQALGHLERAHAGYLASGDLHGAFCGAAAAADAIVFVGSDLHRIDQWMPSLARHAAAYLAQADVETDLRVLPGLLAAFVHLQTAHPLTAPIAERAERLLDQPLGASQRLLLGTLAYYLLWTGQSARLDRTLAKIDRMAASADAAPATLLRWYGVSVLVRSLRGDVETALQHGRQALDAVAHAPPPLRGKAHLMIAIAALADRDATLARTHLRHAEGLLDADNAIDATTYEFQRGILMLLDADWAGADRLMQAAVASGRASGWPLREHIALLGHTLAATQAGRHDEAVAALAAVQAHPFHAVCRWHHWLAGLIAANLAEARGRRPEALAALAQAFAVGREFGFDFGPMPYCCGDMMSRLAALALEHGIDAPFARQLVRRHGLAAPVGAGEPWPWPIRIRVLGGFGIERDGAPAAAPRKESRKPMDLVRLVVAWGGAAGLPVPVPRLCAALWPETEGDAARNSFDNALHRLRKLLGGDRHVRLQAGALSLEPATCWVDAAVLERCLDELEATGQALAGDASAADRLAAGADRALALYRGPLLEGDDELDGVAAARERLAARFARVMAAAGKRLEAQGRAAEAVRIYERVVEQQPLAEDVVRHLIACLIALGRRAEAFEAYRRCRQALSVLLNLQPAPATEALIEPIRNV